MKLIDLFDSSYIIEPNTACWSWTGNTDTKGYAILWLGGSMILAYRFSYFLYKGEIPGRMSVCHSCDNKLCVNPDHLWVGTQSDNMHDMANKKRYNNIGENNKSSKLKENEILEIVRLYKTGEYIQSKLEKMFNVGHTTISDIILGNKWNNITKIKPEKYYNIIPYDTSKSMKLLEKFHSSYNINHNGCWIWKDKIFDTGYGIFYIGGTKYLAHRISYSLFSDEIKKKMVICHSCDIKSCVNPNHLWAGTQYENVQDAIIKGIFRNSISNNLEQDVEQDIIQYKISNPKITYEELENIFNIPKYKIGTIIRRYMTGDPRKR